MPIFFFVGGFSNHKTYLSMKERGEGYREFMKARAVRLLTPTGVFIALWLIAQIALHVVDVGGDRLIRVSFLPFGPLWFLFVYLGVIALTPLTLRLHARFGVGTLVGLVAVAAVGDLFRFNEIA